MIAIEIAYLKGFQNVWLESDSQLVILAFKSKEGNACADSLANLGLSFSSFDLFWSDIIPDFIRGEYIRNRLGMPNFSNNLKIQVSSLVLATASLLAREASHEVALSPRRAHATREASDECLYGQNAGFSQKSYFPQIHSPN
ncbi:hypothetical protein MTR_0126s0110 [Medicago truncatula]|uniref:RNase H type-1 domain-containing protein n=1 Tax=Medicago truncatula TaxID=3880 RepID=A0A072TGZ6_MEDTR|nr:hypothetical protein MTR_0126s0110 [Medicago truncatula]